MFKVNIPKFNMSNIHT